MELRHFPSREFTYVGWNNQRPHLPGRRAVRRALAMAHQPARHHRGAPARLRRARRGDDPALEPAVQRGASRSRYDPPPPRQLLAQAGLADTNGDGVLEKDGQPLRFNLLVNAANRHAPGHRHGDAAAAARGRGRRGRLRTVEFQTLLQQHKARDYDAVISNWTLDTFKVDPTPLFSCAEARTPGSANRAGFCDPAIDALITRGPAAPPTRPQAKPIWADFTRQLQQRQPITFLFWSEDLAGLGPRLQNVVMDVRSKLVNIPELVDPASGCSGNWPAGDPGRRRPGVIRPYPPPPARACRALNPLRTASDTSSSTRCALRATRRCARPRAPSATMKTIHALGGAGSPCAASRSLAGCGTAKAARPGSAGDARARSPAGRR